MSDCTTHESTLEAYLAGERDEAAVGPLIRHSLGCRDCRRLLELHRDLCELSAAAPTPEPAEFETLRGRVLAHVTSTERPSSRSWLRAGAATAAGILLFAVGLFRSTASVEAMR